MNLQLTLANSVAHDAEDRWKAHRRDCPKCADGQRKRKNGEMCNAGRMLYEDRCVTAADLAKERELAKQPLPGQEALF